MTRISNRNFVDDPIVGIKLANSLLEYDGVERDSTCCKKRIGRPVARIITTAKMSTARHECYPAAIVPDQILAELYYCYYSKQ